MLPIHNDFWMSKPVVVVGGGLAGIVCTRRLNRAGVPVLLVESQDALGGRLRTAEIDGFKIDRGFQVYFTAYPHAKVEIDWRKLDLGFFIPGCSVWDGSKFHEVRSDDEIATLFSPWLPLQDKFRMLSYNAEIQKSEYREIWAAEDTTAENDLLTAGFTPKFLDRFVRPFFGGIFLDRSMQTSSRMFRFVWKMLLEGRIGLPAQGMQAIPTMMAADIPSSSIRLNEKVSGLVREGEKVTGIKLASGEVIEAEAVVIATEAPEAARLAGLNTPTGSLSSITVSFDAPEPITKYPLLLLNGPGFGRVNHVVDVSQASPSYAPKGRHLISATVLGTASESDLSLAGNVKSEIQGWLPKANVSAWRPLKVDRISYAQMAQPAGFGDGLPLNETKTPGLYFAGEFTTYSSIDGAILSGQQAAETILGRITR